ncbi:hypothetical protein [Paenibacillus xylanexedens]|uniref:hypothetical protein n=1 Tax=Paenibacillus xylanexedens TaxID=528191 RepID=UPI000F5302D2|nr:hypothetical protein [Paenibacillus xylanexedens]
MNQHNKIIDSDEIKVLFDGKSFIKTVTFEDDNISILYYETYEDMLQNSEKLLITEEEFNIFFTPTTIEKIMIKNTSDILFKFPFVKNISITLKTNNYVYSAKLNKTLIYEFTGVDIGKFNDSNEYKTNFASIHLDKKEIRNKLFQQIVNID